LQFGGLRDAAPTGRLRLRDLPAALTNLGSATGTAGEKENSSPEAELTDEEWASVLKAVARADEKPLIDVNFELFLRVYSEMQLRLKGGKKARDGGGGGIKRSSSSSAAFLTASTTTLLHTISESEKASYVGHINAYLAEDPFLKEALPVDPATDQLFHLTKDGVLLWCAPHQSDLCFRSSDFCSDLVPVLFRCLVQQAHQPSRAGDNRRARHQHKEAA
jgi:plastin-1